MIPKVAPWKKDTVTDLTDMLKKGGTIAVIDIHGVPAGAMLGMRAGLRSSMNIQVAKKRLMKLAWEANGNDFADLEALYSSAVQPALVQTDMNSFEVFSELKKTEAARAAKPGDVAPHDIVVEKMDTGMPPGPIVGDLNSVGIPAKIMKGSVQIQKQVTILKEGEVFEGDLGLMLSKIGINPIVTGLRLCGTIEDGTRFEPATLDIDYEQFEADLISFGAGAFNLACNISWFTPQTTPTLISKASGEALAVALEAAAPRSWLSSSSSASGDKEPAMPIAPRFARPIRCGMVSAVVIAASSATASASPLALDMSVGVVCGVNQLMLHAKLKAPAPKLIRSASNCS